MLTNVKGNSPQTRVYAKQLGRGSDRSNRTRQKLKIATRELLNKVGPENLIVQDISRHAGVSHGLFYRHFRGLEDVVLEVARDFMIEINASTSSLPAEVDWYDLFYGLYLGAMDICLADVGVTCCFFQLTNRYPELKRIWQEGIHEWNIRIASMIREHLGIPKNTAERLAFVIGAAAEGVLMQCVVRRSEDLTRAANNAAEIAEIMATICCRLVFLADPPSEKLRVMKQVATCKPKADITERIENRLVRRNRNGR